VPVILKGLRQENAEFKTSMGSMLKPHFKIIFLIVVEPYTL
jgi:hypothetical protein